MGYFGRKLPQYDIGGLVGKIFTTNLHELGEFHELLGGWNDFQMMRFLEYE